MISHIAPYVDTMENLLNSIPNHYHKTEFLDYVTNIVPDHKYENLLNGDNNGLKEEIIINILKELSSDHSDVMLNLKPSNNEKEFKEKLDKIINTYEKGKENPENKKAISQEIKKELENLDTWCKETAKKDNSHVFKNIGQVIKHSFKALANIGNKEAFKKEQKEVGNLYGGYNTC
ncbi:hypothetical protein [Rickettsia tamurae]|uniref:hypothetical protein n=1 Tax=Rickettsia tamurae TaxID=334545 RepID=UPI001F393E27|nr:hypothetical protein [Rickettsia tamurae]